MDLEHFATVSARHLDRRFIRFQIEYALVFLNDIPFMNLDFKNIA